MRRFFSKLSASLHRRRAEEEMSREIAAHLALIEDDLRRTGMSASEARLAARRVYGGVEQSKEMHRDARSFVWLEQLFQDLRHAFRSLAKSPGFVAVAVVSLALGIGVNTAIFTLVNAILLKTLPVPDPSRIVEPQADIREFQSTAFSFPAYRALRRQTGIFADVIAFQPSPALLGLNGSSRRIDFELVTGSYFDFFGARPLLGRLLNEQDDAVEEASPVCVLGYQAWQRDFGGDPRVLGRIIRLDGVPLQVVGVARPDFVGAELQRSYDVWAPTAMSRDFSRIPRETATWIWLRMLARLKPGVSFTETGARLEAASGAIEGELPAARANDGAVYRILDARNGHDLVRSTFRDPLVVLMSAVTLVLLVACANLANLVLARTRERAREFAIKLSLGISRARLLRQLLLESFALALGGGAAAVLLSFALTRYLVALYNSGNAWVALRLAPDRSVLLYTGATCIATALLAGLYPAWRASRADAGAGLKPGDGHRAGGSAVRRALILVQVSLTAVLLFGAGIFAHSLGNLKTIDLGYKVDRVLTVEIAQSGPSSQLPSGGQAAFASILERVRSLPGIESAALADPGVLTQTMYANNLSARDSRGGIRRIRSVPYIKAGPGYFSTLRMRMVRGREFTAADRSGPPVVIVNQRLAARLWPGQDAIGQRVDIWGRKDVEVVGVAANSKYQEVREKEGSIVYINFDQAGEPTEATLQIRASGPLPAIERSVREIVRTSAPRYQVSMATPLEVLRDNLLAQDRLMAFLSSLFGVLGTVLALVGIYGLISYSVARRTREIGIRVSVGAQKRDVLWMFLRESLALTAAGLLLGLPVAFALARFVRSLLYQVSVSDPMSLTTPLVLILLGGALAALVPAVRATRVDPVRALRYE
jgi:predicted permease